MTNGFDRDIEFTRWLFRVYLLILFLLPLPLGSNRPFFWSVFVASVAAVALVWAVGWLLKVVRWPHAMERGRWPLFVLAAFVDAREVERVQHVKKEEGGEERVHWAASAFSSARPSAMACRERSWD